MRILVIGKRVISGQDLTRCDFGRYCNLVAELTRRGHAVQLILLDNAPASMGPPNPNSPHPCFGWKRLYATPSQFVRRWKPEILVAGGHLHLGVLGCVLSWRFGIPWVYDVYDFYPVFLRAFHPLGDPFFRLLLTRAHGISAASPAIANYAGKLNDRVSVIRNATHADEFRKMARVKAREALGLEVGETILGFTGRVADHVMAKECLDSLQSLGRELKMSLHMAQIGPPPADPLVRARIRALGNRPVPEVASFINACDIVAVPYLNCACVKYSNACKLSECCACEAVVVASRNGDALSYFSDEYPGLFDPSDPEGLLRALRRQLLRPVPAKRSLLCFWETSADGMEALLTETRDAYRHS